MASLPPELALLPNIGLLPNLAHHQTDLVRVWLDLEVFRLGPRGRMLSPSIEPEGSWLSLRASRHLNGPTIAAKMAGTNTTNL